MSYEIELTEDESDLLQQIELDMARLDHTQLERQGPLVLRLLQSLRERNAIPKVRLRYWSDADYATGRVKASHQGLFERNGRRGSEIFTNPQFLKYLRYFLFGADLPKEAIVEFEEAVGDPKWVTSGDATAIAKAARRIVRQYGLRGDEEEFYRLALDMGLDQPFARTVRDAAKQAR